jgi:hypothetical protein
LKTVGALRCVAIIGAVAGLASSVNRGSKARDTKRSRLNWKKEKGVDKIDPLWYNNTKR